MQFLIAAIGWLIFMPEGEAGFQIVQTAEQVPERGTVVRLLVKASAGEFALNPPPGWSASSDPARESLIFERETENAVMVLRFSTNAAPGGKELHGWITEHWPHARILDNGNAFCRDARGEFAEFTYVSAASSHYRARLVNFLYPRGNVAIELTAPDGWPPLLHHSWTGLLNSLESRTDPKKGDQSR